MNISFYAAFTTHVTEVLASLVKLRKRPFVRGVAVRTLHQEKTVKNYPKSFLETTLLEHSQSDKFFLRDRQASRYSLQGREL